MNALQISYRKPADLQANPRNARTHGSKQIKLLASSIEVFGFNDPILIDRDDVVIAGHCRLEAAKLLGLTQVPTVLLEHLDEHQKRAFMIAANKLAELAGWSKELLTIELGELAAIDLDFNLDVIGFETAELDSFLLVQEDGSDPGDMVPEMDNVPAVARVGDLFRLGEHRLLCGDALLAENYERLLGSERAQAVISDVPYNLKIDGVVSGLGKHKHRDFAMASGEMSEAEFTRFLTTAFRHFRTYSIDGSLHYVFMDWRHIYELLRAGRIVFDELKNIVVWAKTSGGMGSMYRSRHELIGIFKSGTASHVNNVQLGKFGRNRTNVWEYAGMNSFHEDRDESLAMHSTVKPLTMISDAILDCSDRGKIVLDPFVGSGTTILAAQRTGRRCAAMELDPGYIDVALHRFRTITSIEPIHDASGKTLSELISARSCEAAAELAR